MRVRRWVLGTAAAIGLYALLGFLAAPPIARSYLIQTLQQLLHRQVAIRRLRLNPFVLSATADGLRIQDTDGAPLLTWDRLYVNFQLLSFVQREWVFRQVQLVNPSGRLLMHKDGTFNVSDILDSLSAAPQTPASPGEAPQFRIGRLRIQDARLEYLDQSRPTEFRTVLGPLRVDLRDFGTQRDSKNPYSFSGRTESGESFSWKGHFSLDPIRSGGQFAFTGIRLNKYHPYYQENVLLDIKDGNADFSSTYEFEWGPQRRIARLADANLKITTLKIAEPGRDELVVDVPEIALARASVDALTGETRVESLDTRDGSLILRKYPDGTINLRRMIEPLLAEDHPPTQASAAGSTPTAAQAAQPAAGPGPTILISDVRFTNFKVLLEDLSTPRPVRVHCDQVAMDMHNVDNRPETTSTGKLSFRWEEGGSVALAGDLSIIKLQGNLDAKFDRVDIAPLDPYVEPTADLRVSSGRLSADGRIKVSLLDPAHPTLAYQGNLILEDFLSVDGARRADFLKCKRLEIAPMDFSLDPFHLHVGEVIGQDPAVRLAFDEQGNNNLFTILRLPPAGPGSETTITKPASPSLPPASAAPSPALGDMTIRRVRLKNGRILYEDRSLRPPVRLSLDHLNGTVSGLSSKELARADLSLEARLDNVAPLKLAGKINPLSENRYSDLALEMHAADLMPLGPYSSKYLGYALQKGKASLEMKYLLSQRSLTASNLITIDQLLLGEKVESPDATKLPVKLGVALLKDRNGVIKLDVPVEGSLDDPQFRLGRVIVHAIGVVFTKLVTSPFRLLARAFGGSEEDLSSLDFEAGSDALPPASLEKLNLLITSLYERPALTLEIRGSVEEASDREGLKRKKLDDLLRREKWSSLSRKEQAATPAESITFSEAEMPSLIKPVFKTAWSKGMGALFPGTAPAPSQEQTGEKPDTPEAMESWLLAHIEVSADELRQLAARRAGSVRDYILGTGKVEAERIFLAEKTDTNTTGGSRADLTLD